MAERNGPPPRPEAMPLWAWVQWAGPSQRKPDMRSGGHYYSGRTCFRLTLDLPEYTVLLSDFDDWHSVLNNWYHTLNEAEFDAFCAEIDAAGVPWGGPYPEPFQARITASWERIFAKDRSDVDPAWSGDPGQRSIQATFWKLSLRQVRRIEKFKAW